ncbi:MAG: hypothetical protein IKN16_09660 [Selenomonadaceae bacterium]|nr:hypothetical protein [Selenomonadaceae bacterium]
MASKKAMAIAIERDEVKMTITIAPVGTKTRVYYVDGYKYSRATANIYVQDYINRIVGGESPNAAIYLDKRLADDFTVLTNSPFKGEFKLVYTGNDGQPISFEPQITTPASVDMKPYRVEIVMYGDKKPLFDILVNGKCINGSISSRSLVQKDVDAWLIKAYQMRKQYPNMTVEIPRVVAWGLDVFNINPSRFLAELHVTLTEETTAHDLAESAIA